MVRLEVNESRIPVFAYAKEPHHYVITCYIQGVQTGCNESRIPFSCMSKRHHYVITSAFPKAVFKMRLASRGFAMSGIYYTIYPRTKLIKPMNKINIIRVENDAASLLRSPLGCEEKQLFNILENLT